MEYPNLRDAFQVMWLDNIPKPLNQPVAAAAMLYLQQNVAAESLSQAEAALATVRQPNDIHDIDSPLWQLCCGDRSEWSTELCDLCGEESPLNEALEWLFESLA